MTKTADAPKRTPFKVADEAQPQADVAQEHAPAAAPTWQAIDTGPVDADAMFYVRGPKSKALLVRYRRTRAVNPATQRFEPFLLLVDAQSSAKLSFKPTEWMPYAAPEEGA